MSMSLSSDERHRMLCFLADWFLVSLPPGLSEHSRLEVWDREYEYSKSLFSDAQLWETARELGYGKAERS